jgi:hypothetical protein
MSKDAVQDENRHSTMPAAAEPRSTPLPSFLLLLLLLLQLLSSASALVREEVNAEVLLIQSSVTKQCYCCCCSTAAAISAHVCSHLLLEPGDVQRQRQTVHVCVQCLSQLSGNHQR